MEHPIAQPITLHYVRYYTQYYHPRTFRGMGFLGVLIRFLNWTRYWIETLVQRLVLTSLVRSARANGVELPRVKTRLTVRRFWDDVMREGMMVRGELEQADIEAELQHQYGVDPKAFKYLFGKKAAVVQDVADSNDELPTIEGEEKEEGPKRPRPLDQMMSRYSAPPKERRYALGAQRVVFEDEIEEVPATPAQHERARELVKENRMRPPAVAAGTPAPPLSVVPHPSPAKVTWGDLLQQTKRVPNPGPEKV